jgi:hypothetical protein
MVALLVSRKRAGTGRGPGLVAGQRQLGGQVAHAPPGGACLSGPGARGDVGGGWEGLEGAGGPAAARRRGHPPPAARRPPPAAAGRGAHAASGLAACAQAPRRRRLPGRRHPGGRFAGAAEVVTRSASDGALWLARSRAGAGRRGHGAHGVRAPPGAERRRRAACPRALGRAAATRRRTRCQRRVPLWACRAGPGCAPGGSALAGARRRGRAPHCLMRHAPTPHPAVPAFTKPYFT